MNIIRMMGFSKFLEMKFIEWQQLEGGRKTVKEFAEWLGFKQSTVSTWWSDKYPPNEESANKLANRLGPEVYDVLGMERPDPLLTRIEQVWERLPLEARHALAEEAERYSIENKKKENGDPIEIEKSLVKSDP